MHDDPWLTVRQVARELTVTEKTVRRWIATGRVKAAKITDRSGWRIRRSEIERLLHPR